MMQGNLSYCPECVGTGLMRCPCLACTRSAWRECIYAGYVTCVCRRPVDLAVEMPERWPGDPLYALVAFARGREWFSRSMGIFDMAVRWQQYADALEKQQGEPLDCQMVPSMGKQW